MSRGPYPILLMLAMSLPGAAKALGLGDIRVDSALNEPLSAQIDIVGATRDELVELTAKVANREVFQRYAAERPAFLATATFKVGLDSQGRPVLNVRSAEAFTDPVINFLVDLRWGKGELIREYSLLLDPAGFSSTSRVAETVPAVESAPASAVASTPAVAAAPAVAAWPDAANRHATSTRGRAASAPISSQHRVVARDTLRAIARRAGARTESHAQRMMIAIFRANPHAFESNINILHLGALLSIPSAQDVEAIDSADARREVRAQMTAWRLDGRPAATAQASVAQPALEPVQPETTHAAANAVLKDRVQSLEKSLEEMHQQLAAENAKIQDLKQLPPPAAATAEPAAAAVTTADASPVVVERMRVQERPAPVLAAIAPAPDQQAIGKGVLGAIAIGLALLLGGFAYLRRRVSLAVAPATPALPADNPLPKSDLAPAPQPETITAAKAAPVVRVQERPLPVPADAIVAREITVRTPSSDFDETMGIDTVALERSYLDSLGVDSFGIDETSPHQAVADATAAHDTAEMPRATQDTGEMHTVALDTSELDTAVVQADLNTAILDTKKLDPAAINGTVLDYNLLDLDATTQHVHMPSDLLDQAVVKDRRTNIVDVLKQAIARDPERRDLRMKLLETYYSTAATNQRGFLEVVRKLSREPGFLSADDWQKVVMMGRVIAPADILFADQARDDDLANCA